MHPPVPGPEGARSSVPATFGSCRDRLARPAIAAWRAPRPSSVSARTTIDGEVFR